MNFKLHRIQVSFAFIILYSIVFSQDRSEKLLQDRVRRAAFYIDNYELNKALALADSIEKYMLKPGNKKEIGNLYNLKGTIYREKSDPKAAIDYFHRAKDINESINNEGGLATNYVNLGSMYSFLQENKTALTYYFKAEKIYDKLNNKNGLAVLYNNIGNIYLQTDRPKNALDYFEKAFQLAKLNDDSLNMAMVSHNLGNCAEKVYGTDSALAYYNRSLLYLFGLGEGIGHMYNYNQIGNIFYGKKKYDEAAKYVLKSLEINKREAVSFEEMATSYGILIAIYKKKGDLKKAFEYQGLLLNVKDTLTDRNSREELMKVQFESELKNQKKEQELMRTNQEAINKAKLESKNKNLYLSYGALGFAVIMGLVILNGYRQKQKANKIISKQKEEVEHKNSEILASINYAKRIQYALLAHKEFMSQNFSEHFILFDPKDIVSGDFYWATKHNGKLYLAVCDSTGHGVPGAFMCLLNIGFLSEAINEKNITEPNRIFDHVRTRLVESISKEGQKDGFDGILICIDEKKITYAAANNAPVLISNGTILELEKDKMPVGIGEMKGPFGLYEIKPKAGDMLYLYTDGYPDQFGGPKGKKYKYKQLNDRLLEWSNLAMEEQRTNLANDFKQWKGKLEQVDDVCVIGIRF